MRSSRFSNVQIEAGVAKHDTSVPEHSLPTAEALSRWENEGGAPDRREEPANRKVPDARMLQIARPAESAAGRHLKGSVIDPQRRTRP